MINYKSYIFERQKIQKIVAFLVATVTVTTCVGCSSRTDTSIVSVFAQSSSFAQIVSGENVASLDNLTISSEGESNMSEQSSDSKSSDIRRTFSTTNSSRSNSVVSKNNASIESNNMAESNPYKEYIKYNLDTYMTPVWKNKVVYNESVMFFPNAETREYDPAPLLYTPTKVLSVRSSDLKTEYEEGIDYVIENGKIKLTSNSRIPKWEYDDYYLKTAPEGFACGSVRAPGRYICFASGKKYAQMQLAVTYEHNAKWKGEISKYEGNVLKNTISKLKQKKLLQIVYYGDSIMTGCDVTSTYGIAPSMPIFTQMITAKLKEVYGYDKIIQYNTAVGGKETRWGLEELETRVANIGPDLVVIGFGMNDSALSISVLEYEKNIRKMIENVRKENSNAEFLLVSTTLPNPDCKGYTKLQPKYQAALENIVDDFSGVALVPMTDIHTYILTKKRYDDMAGNGVNHPNDFLARIYGQAVAQCLIENLD